ncbi:MAG TPA: hypothetical protein VIV40_42280 [Kofleriaceae bacterium]
MLFRLAAAFALLSACTGASSTGIEPISCPPTGTTLTYANFGDELIANKCTTSGCHDRQRPNLTTQLAIQQNAANILDQAVYTDAMPRNTDMQLMEREKLGEWLACGAP